MMGQIAAGLAGAGAFLVVASLLAMFWPRVTKATVEYGKASAFHDPMSAAIIAAAGGQTELGRDRDNSGGITSEAHDYLGLSKDAYDQGLVVLGMVSAFFGVLFFLILGAGLIMGVVIGVFFGVFAYGIIRFTEGDKIKSRAVEQVRQFPFFLDIFLLMVQSNGNIDDAIDTYREIFGDNDIALELAILQEDLRSQSLLDSFERLRNRVGDEDLRNVLGELTQKLRTGTDLQTTLEQQSEDMRTLREELGAQAAERLNAKFAFPVVFAALATLMIFLAPAIAQMTESGFL